MRSHDGFDYLTRVVTERIGSVELRMECLDDLNRTIDSLFEELQRRGEPELLERYCPYFGVIWASARALAGYVASKEREMAGASVLELGCGLALPGLLAARLGANVVATDGHPDVPLFLERNTAHNGISTLEYLELDWHSPGQATSMERRFQWVLASDVLYEKQQPAQLAPVLDAMLAHGGTAVITDPGRPYLQSFVDEMHARGFESAISVHRVPDVGSDTEVFELVFRRR